MNLHLKNPDLRLYMTPHDNNGRKESVKQNKYL